MAMKPIVELQAKKTRTVRSGQLNHPHDVKAQLRRVAIGPR
jgi:hypothetical protein